MATAVDSARQEVGVAITVIGPQLEGLHDFDRLNISAMTKEVVEQEIHDYQRRLDLLQAAASALDALDADGYPGIPARDVAEVIYADLHAQLDQITAAFATFQSNKAETLDIKADPPALK